MFSIFCLMNIFTYLHVFIHIQPKSEWYDSFLIYLVQLHTLFQVMHGSLAQTKQSINLNNHSNVNTNICLFLIKLFSTYHHHAIFPSSQNMWTHVGSAGHRHLFFLCGDVDHSNSLPKDALTRTQETRWALLQPPGSPAFTWRKVQESASCLVHSRTVCQRRHPAVWPQSDSVVTQRQHDTGHVSTFFFF